MCAKVLGDVFHTSRLGNHDRVGAMKIRGVHENLVDAFERDTLDSTVPTISGMKSIIEMTTSVSVDISTEHRCT